MMTFYKTVMPYADAVALAKRLNEEDEDGWTYHVVTVKRPSINLYATIEVTTDDRFIGYL